MRTTSRLTLALLTLTVAGCGPVGPRPWYRWIEPEPEPEPVPMAKAVDPELGPMIQEDFTGRTFARPLSPNDAFAILLNTETFADTHVGYAASKSVQVEAFQALIDRPDARGVFDDLLNRGRIAGRLYALCGIYLLAPDDFEAAEERVSASVGTASVAFFSACTVLERPARDLIRSSSAGAVRMRPGESVDDARRRVGGDSAAYDIAGGAYPHLFQDAK